jgi:hypothetical protein
MRNDNCRFCRAPILWATSEEGRPVPLDPCPRSDGNIDVVDDVTHVWALGAKRPAGDRYVNHFATCAGGVPARNRGV